MAEIRDLPGQLDVWLYIGRPTTLTLTWPTTLAGKTFTCKVNYGDGVIKIYTVSVATVTMTIVLAVADYPTELTPGTIQIIETTGGLSTPIIAGAVHVTRDLTAASSTATVTVTSSTVAVSIQTWATLFPTFATVAARTAGIASPVAGNGAYLTTPKIQTWYNGTSWDGQVPTFASFATLNTAIPTPDTGMMARISGIEELVYWTGAAWQFVGGVATFASAAARDAAITSPVTGMMARLSDVEQLTYYNGSAWLGMRVRRFSATGVGGTTSGTTNLVVNTITIPDQGCSGFLHVTQTLYMTATTANDQYNIGLRSAGTTFFAQPINTMAVGGGAPFDVGVTGEVAMAAGGSRLIETVVSRFFGTGTAAIAATAITNRLDVLFVPD